MDELQMMMLIKTLVPIIAIFIIGIYLVYALTKKNKERLTMLLYLRILLISQRC